MFLTIIWAMKQNLYNEKYYAETKEGYDTVLCIYFFTGRF
jgi:hypothetical protein